MKRKAMALLLLAVSAAVTYAGIVAIIPPAMRTAVWADVSDVPETVNHQGVVTVNGVRFSGSGTFRFAIVDPDSGNNVWTNDNTNEGSANAPTNGVSLTVTDGIYSVRLGDTSLTNMTTVPSSLFEDGNLKLRIWFDDGTNGSQQLSPDHTLSSVPYAMTVADGVVTEAKLAAGVGVPAGALMSFVGASAPTGWLFCDGSAVSRTTYAGLFAIVGTTYGSGDGSTTFNLPDLRGRVPMGAGTGTGGGASGNGQPAGGSGLTARTRADWGGEETHTLTIPEMPNHSHQWLSGGGGAAGGGQQYARNDAGFNVSAPTTAVGGGGAHNNIQPFMVVNYIVKY